MIAEDLELRHALAGVPLLSWSGPLHRAVAGRHIKSLASVRGSLFVDNRYTRANTCTALYTSHYPELALLEVLQGSAFSEAFPGATPALQVTFSAAVNLTRVLDLMDEAVQRALGTNVQELTGEWRLMNERGQNAPTQRLGRAAFELGQVEAVRYPSKIQPKRGNVLLFKDRLNFVLAPLGLPPGFPDQDLL